MRSAVRMDAEPLRLYVRDVQCRVLPDHCGDVRVQVFRRAAFNATVMPNGYTEVWSGLLLRLQNEAQLAFVLGHEGAHYTGNHSLRQWESMKRMQGALLALTIVAGAAASYDASFADYGSYVDALQTAAYLGALAGLFAYSREFEEEADRVGQQVMANAGYDPREAERVWAAVKAFNAASDNERVRRSESWGSVFRTHPLTAARLASLQATAPQLEIALRGPDVPATGEVALDRYRAMIRPYLGGWLRDELRRRDFGATLALLGHLKQGGDPGVLAYYEGEVYRLRRGSDDQARARDAYQKAASYPDAPAETWRELGSILARESDRAGALAAYEQYLVRAPEASDRQLIQRQVERLHASAPPTPQPVPTPPPSPTETASPARQP
jgi:beta-barrel assembly-enhancing protease